MAERTQRFAVVVAALMSLVWAQPAVAQPAPEGSAMEQSYGVYYGDGLRYFAEGRFDAAVESLFRAYGMRPSESVMELIIDAYDSMGHCDAVERQTRFFRGSHDPDRRFELDRCAARAELIVSCQQAGRVIELNGQLRGGCAERLTVPADEDLVVTIANTEFRQTISIAEGQREQLNPGEKRAVYSQAQVKRLSGWATRVDRLPLYFGEQARVSRLSDPTAPYRVYESEDGIYQVWMRSEADEEADTVQPRVEIVCPEDAPDGQEEEGCQWLRELRQRTPEGTQRPQRFEVFVPRVP